MIIRTSLAAAAFLTAGATASAQGYGYDRGYGNGYGYDAQAASAYGQQRANERCRDAQDDQKLAGALVGGVLGAVAGGLIVENNTDDEYRYARHGRDYGRRGHRGYRGYRRHGRHGGYRYKDSNDGEVAAGAILGAVVGGLAGSQLAKSTVNCDTQWKYDVPPPTRSAHGPGWESGPQRVSARTQYPFPEEPLYGGTSGQTVGQDCERVWRETRMPDGRVVREQVMACRDGQIRRGTGRDYGEWEIREGCGLQTRDPDCIG